MKQEKRRHTPEFKAQVALEAIKGRFSVAELSEKYEVHASLIHTWKRMVLNSAPKILEKGGKIANPNHDVKREKQREVERLTRENEWLQKILLRLSAAERREAVLTGDTKLPLLRQVKLLNINRSAVYYHRRHEAANEERVGERIAN